MSTKTKIQGGIGHEHYISKLSMRGHLIVADEPHENGGKDSGPTPTELILSGLAACTAATLRMYADKKGWDVERIDLEVSIRIEKTDAGQISHVESLIDITGNITAEEKARMIEIAQKCPVHKLLSNPIQIQTNSKP
ncbi:MAG: OsmC family protein [Saprospiraceae bacterium]|nr:OsmC family protein [Saprospiraceae bacterium]